VRVVFRTARVAKMLQRPADLQFARTGTEYFVSVMVTQQECLFFLVYCAAKITDYHGISARFRGLMSQ
jgi:hypothetical protein